MNERPNPDNYVGFERCYEEDLDAWYEYQDEIEDTQQDDHCIAYMFYLLKMYHNGEL